MDILTSSTYPMPEWESESVFIAKYIYTCQEWDLV